MQDASHWIVGLQLQPHPEGGHYRETYRCKDTADGMLLREKRTGMRSLSSSIYFLLCSGEKSLFHRLRSDEIWYYQLGSALNLCCIDDKGNSSTKVLGPHPSLQQVLQLAIPAGTIFGCYPAEQHSFTLAGCMVSPGFDFEDFEILSREYLLGKYPREHELIMQLTRETKSSTLYY